MCDCNLDNRRRRLEEQVYSQLHTNMAGKRTHTFGIAMDVHMCS